MVVINRAMETSRLRRENSSLRRGGDRVADMLGQSAAFKRLRDGLDKVARSNGRVMLAGEPGTGKEMAARYIHAHSPRASAPFITVPCATIEPERMEEVLFGRESPERGIEPGLLEQAHGGIIYFDEVGDMPMGTQPKILRVLTEQQFVRAGGADKVRVDLRVLSSTNRDLVAEIAAGRFRQELFDRLNVVPIAVPSLADRRDDIAALARHFIEQFHKNQGLTPRDLPEETVAALQSMRWPGNIRELRNVIERVLIWRKATGRSCRRAGALGGHARQQRRPVPGTAGHRHGPARGARDVRARIPGSPDQPLRRQHQPHRAVRRHGAQRAAPQAEVAWGRRRDARRGRVDDGQIACRLRGPRARLRQGGAGQEG